MATQCLLGVLCVQSAGLWERRTSSCALCPRHHHLTLTKQAFVNITLMHAQTTPYRDNTHHSTRLQVVPQPGAERVLHRAHAPLHLQPPQPPRSPPFLPLARTRTRAPPPRRFLNDSHPCLPSPSGRFWGLLAGALEAHARVPGVWQDLRASADVQFGGGH